MDLFKFMKDSWSDGKPPQEYFCAVLKIAHQIAETLLYMHRSKWCHRDLKPENLLLAQTGEFDVIDFGSSAQTGQYKRFKGSPGNLPPETVPPYQKKIVSPATDIWQFGVLLHMLWHGFNPFNQVQSLPNIFQPNVQDWLSKFLDVLDQIRTDLEQSQDPFDRFVAQLLHPDPDSRPKDDAIVKELGRLK